MCPTFFATIFATFSRRDSCIENPGFRQPFALRKFRSDSLFEPDLLDTRKNTCFLYVLPLTDERMRLTIDLVPETHFYEFLDVADMCLSGS